MCLTAGSQIRGMGCWPIPAPLAAPAQARVFNFSSPISDSIYLTSLLDDKKMVLLNISF